MITVIAGVNGAGKSSIIGEALRANGGEYFNPDEATRLLMKADPQLSLEEANSQAWHDSKSMLEEAIAHDKDFAFETTLGGNTIASLLINACNKGIDVSVFYCGLTSAEMHIERVKARVKRGGHDIPEKRIRERWKTSVRNMMELVAICHSARIFDNSAPMQSAKPNPVPLFRFENKTVTFEVPEEDVPDWAKPIAMAALKASHP